MWCLPFVIEDRQEAEELENKPSVYWEIDSL